MTNEPDKPTNQNGRENDPFNTGPEDIEYPPVLQITANPQEQARRSTKERLREWQAGETVPHVINFQERKMVTSASGSSESAGRPVRSGSTAIGSITISDSWSSPTFPRARSVR